MRIPKAFYLLFCVALLASVLPLAAAAQQAAPIEPELLARLAAEGTANFFVKMALEADLGAAKGLDWAARGRYVWNALNEVANATQGPVLDYCAKNGLACTPMLINNSVFVRSGSLDSARGLAALPGVSYLRMERIYALDPLVGGVGIHGFETAGASPDATTDWGITDTKADQFWATFGVKGDNIKVANIDTGVQWNHPALQDSFACASGSDANCWADPSNICGGTACDNNGHGTHTMGTMVANDDPALSYIAGMAPNASWIACKGCESNSCSDFALTTCATWIVAPNGNPDLRPDVVNNSWGGGGGDTWYQSYVQSWVAAGIFPAFSAGNSGSSCSTLGSPGDYQESFASAAHDSARSIASFSSRGPSAFGHDPYTKPNVSAPGVSICSSVPTNAWSCGYSGTSMASPHTAGAVALLWSCNPSLVGQIDLTFQALQDSADTPPAGSCGAPPDGEGNYTFGYGYLDVLNAGIAYCGGVETGTLDGYVYDDGGSPIEGAIVSAQQGAEGAGINATTDPNGFYTMELVVGTYNVTASKTNYTSQTQTGIEVLSGQTTTLPDFVLTFLGAWTQLAPLPGCPDWTRYDGHFYNNKVYFLGGRSDTSTYGDVIYLDPATGTCTDTGVNMPDPVSNYTINQVNNGTYDLLCTFGGRAASGTSTLTVQCFNPATNSASIVTTLPTAYTGYTPGGQAVVDNMVYVFGGFNNAASPYELNRTDRYDPMANTFTQIGNLSLARSYIDSAVVDGKIYAFGGTVFDGASLYAQTKTEVMADPGGAGTWDDASVAELPVASAEGRAWGFDSGSGYVLDNQIIIAGGGQWPAESSEALVYDIATDTYDYDFPNLNVSRRDHAGVWVPGNPGKMWVFGGRSSVSGYGGDLPPYAPPEYYEVQAQPTPFKLHLFRLRTSWRAGANPGTYRVLANGIVHDQGHAAVAGVALYGDWTLPNGRVIHRTATTDALGRWRIPISTRQAGSYQFCVTDMVLAGFAYDPASNHVSPCQTLAVGP